MNSEIPVEPATLPEVSRFYNIEGEPITGHIWSELFYLSEYKMVAYDEIGPGVKVSTVWLGLDHAFFGGPPLIFETMVFTLKDEPYVMPSGTEYWWDGVEQYRYSTLAEALEGHAKILNVVRTLEGAV